MSEKTEGRLPAAIGDRCDWDYYDAGWRKCLEKATHRIKLFNGEHPRCDKHGL